jgi:GR25 family glycosyltransferase involved in LPS biosynthesis
VRKTVSTNGHPKTLVQVINLARRPDRRESIAKELQHHGITPDFVDAVDGLGEIGESPLGLLPSEVGVWQSHVKAMKNYLKTSEDYGVILEDDATLGKTFDPSSLGAILQLIRRNEIDILQIGYIDHLYRLYRPRGLLDLMLALKENRFVLDKESGLTIVRNEFRAGAHAYFVSRRGALAISNSLPTPPLMAFDTFLEQLAKTSRHPEGIQIARLSKSLVQQRSRFRARSTIDSDVI